MDTLPDEPDGSELLFLRFRSSDRLVRDAHPLGTPIIYSVQSRRSTVNGSLSYVPHNSSRPRSERSEEKLMPPLYRDSDVNRLNTSDPFGSTNTAAAQSALKKAKPRIVILSVTQDASTQYVPIMNCIFSAQKNVRVCCAPPFCYLRPCTLS
jgi:hypothetical protein